MTKQSGAHAFCRLLRQLCPNIGKNFVKFKAELQKLDHLTCSKLKI